MTDVEKLAQQYYDESPYLNQRDLGKRLGLSSHKVGKLLTAKGLREDKMPTFSAFKQKLAITDCTGRWRQYRWNERLVVPILREMLWPSKN